jgi:ribokinase
VKFDVVGFGALNLDRTFRVHQIAHEDNESYITSASTAPGGSAANTIVGLSRLGLQTGFIGKVAADAAGTQLLQSFEIENVNVDGVLITETGISGTVYCFVDEHGERAMYIDPGANDTLTFDELNLDYCRDAIFLHYSSFTGPLPFHAQIQLWNHLPHSRLSIDPGTIYAMKGLQTLEPLIKNCHVFFPNEYELYLLTEENYIAGAQILLDLGIQIVAVKLGARGCYVTNGRDTHTIAPPTVEVFDTTGAGDAFCAGFLYGLLQEQDLHTWGTWGNHVASHILATSGARQGLPDLRELVNKNFRW